MPQLLSFDERLPALQKEEERFMEYIHMPECMVGGGELFALIAKGKSMVDAGIHPPMERTI